MTRRSATVLALFVALACKPHKATSPDGQTDGKGHALGPDGKPIVIAPVQRMAETLPANSALLFEVAGPDRVAEIIGRDALVQRFAAQYRELTDDMVRATGRDFLDPKQLADMGIDTKGRMGFALVSLQPTVMVAFATLANKGRFREAVFEIAKKQDEQIEATPLGHAEILRIAKGRSAIVIREPFVAVFLPTLGDRSKSDPAFDLATMDPIRSLAATKDYKKATGGIAPADATLFVDGGALSEAVLASMGGGNPPVAQNWARDELAKARQNNAPPERIAELEAQARQVDEDNARWVRRQKGERELYEKLFGGIQSSMWSVDAKPTGAVGQSTTSFAADSPMLLALENGTGSPPLARALDGRPLFMVSGKTSVEQLVALADLFAKADGTTWAEASAEMGRETGIDPDRDLKPLVTGRIGFAVTKDSEKASDGPKQLGIALHVEVHDPKGAQAVLAKAAKVIDGKDGLKVRKAGDGWIVDAPKWRKIHAGVQGPHLVISTDAKLLGRIAGGSAGSITKLADGEALAAASLPDTALSLLFDPELSSLFLLGRMHVETRASVESPEDAKVPKSRAWKAKERELAAAKKKLDKAQAAREDADAERFGAVVRPWGSLAGNVRREGNALVAQGGWFVRSKGIAGALSDSLDAVKKMEEARQSDETSKLLEERFRLENELQEQRRKDIEAFRARKGR